MSTPLFPYRTYVETVPCGALPGRVDAFLARRTALSRTKIQKAIAAGLVSVNQKTVSAGFLLHPNDRVTARLPLPQASAGGLVPEPIPLSIAYEDAALLVVNKPAALAVHPENPQRSGTLAHALVHWYEGLPLKDGDPTRPGLVHRLDKGTSGLLVVAKTAESLQVLEAEFRRRAVQRTYYALVWGTPSLDRGTIDLPLSKSLASAQGLRAFPDRARGKRAVTHYQVLQRMHHVSLVACRLETGRTHQIRVHMQQLGHPLFGDPLYGGRTVVRGQVFAAYKAFVQNCFAVLPHQSLHAATLGFIHPVSRRFCRFAAPLPPSFVQLLEKWRRYVGLGPEDCPPWADLPA